MSARYKLFPSPRPTGDEVPALLVDEHGTLRDAASGAFLGHLVAFVSEPDPNAKPTVYFRRFFDQPATALGRFALFTDSIGGTRTLPVVIEQVSLLPAKECR